MQFSDAKQHTMRILSVQPCLGVQEGEKRLKTPLNRFPEDLPIMATVSD